MRIKDYLNGGNSQYPLVSLSGLFFPLPMPEGELYDESTVIIDLPESSVEEVPPVPTPSLPEQQEEELQEPLASEPQKPVSQSSPSATLQTIPSLPPLAEL